MNFFTFLFLTIVLNHTTNLMTNCNGLLVIPIPSNIDLQGKPIRVCFPPASAPYIQWLDPPNTFHVASFQSGPPRDPVRPAQTQVQDMVCSTNKMTAFEDPDASFSLCGRCVLMRRNDFDRFGVARKLKGAVNNFRILYRPFNRADPLTQYKYPADWKSEDPFGLRDPRKEDFTVSKNPRKSIYN